VKATLVLALCFGFFAPSTRAETTIQGKWFSEYSTSPQAPGDENKRSSFESQLVAALRTSPDFWVQGEIGFTQILEPTPEFNLVNPSFRGFYRITDPSLQTFKIEIGPTTAFALSEKSRRESLYLSAGAAVRFSLKGSNPIAHQTEGGFSAYYDLALNRNFHQYETSDLGEVNTEYSLDHFLYAEYDFKGPFLIDAWVGFSSAWSYQGEVSNDYTLGQEIVFSPTDWMDLSILHERGGDFLSPSGQTYNFGLFDANESRFAGTVTLYF